MSKKTKAFLLSIAIGIIIVLFGNLGFTQQVSGLKCDGLGCVGTGIILVFISVVIVPVGFGIYGFYSSTEKKLKGAVVSFTSSLAGMVLLLSAVLFWKIIEQKNGNEKANQEFQYMPAPERKL